MVEKIFQKPLFNNRTLVGIEGGEQEVLRVAKLLMYPPSHIFKTHNHTTFPRTPIPREHWQTPVAYVGGEVSIVDRQTFILKPVILTKPRGGTVEDINVRPEIVIDLRDSDLPLSVNPWHFDPHTDLGAGWG